MDVELHPTVSIELLVLEREIIIKTLINEFSSITER